MTQGDRREWLNSELLSADLSDTDGGMVLHLRGEIDVSNADMFRDRLDAEDRWSETVVLDLAELRFCDSSGLRVFLRGAEAARAAGGRLVLRHPPATVVRAIEVTGLADHLEVEP